MVEVVLFLNSFPVNNIDRGEHRDFPRLRFFEHRPRACRKFRPAHARRNMSAARKSFSSAFGSPCGTSPSIPPEPELPILHSGDPAPRHFFALIFRRLHSQKKLPPSCFFIDFLRCFETESCGEGQVIVKLTMIKIGPGVW